jgi:hypothetical protein
MRAAYKAPIDAKDVDAILGYIRALIASNCAITLGARIRARKPRHLSPLPFCRMHRTVGQGADLDCPRGGGFQAIGAEWPRQPDDAEAGAEALFGMWTALEDQLA